MGRRGGEVIGEERRRGEECRGEECGSRGEEEQKVRDIVGTESRGDRCQTHIRPQTQVG